jgi:multiple sugar transport system permease protein
MPMRRHDARAAGGFLAPFGILFALFFVLPIGYAIYQSLFRIERTGALGLGGEEEVFAGLDNYVDALQEPGFVDSLVRVMVFMVIQVPVMILLALVLALLLEAASSRGTRVFFRTAYFLPFGVPGVIASILWGFLYVPGVSPIVSALDGVGLHVDFLSGDMVLLSIVNIVTWEFVGYNMVVLVAQLKSIDPNLYESARVDGANGWHIVRYIKLPLVRPAIVLTTVFTIIGTLQLFAEPLILRPIATSIGFHYTPNMAAWNEAFNNNNYHLAAAEAVLLAVLAMVLSFGFLRLFGRDGGRR